MNHMPPTSEPETLPAHAGAGTAHPAKAAASPAPKPGGGPRFLLAARTWTFVCFVLLYALPGLIGHEPWKQDETYIAEIVRNMGASGDLVVPRMADETFMEKPPLY